VQRLFAVTDIGDEIDVLTPGVAMNKTHAVVWRVNLQVGCEDFGDESRKEMSVRNQSLSRIRGDINSLALPAPISAGTRFTTPWSRSRILSISEDFTIQLPHTCCLSLRVLKSGRNVRKTISPYYNSAGKAEVAQTPQSPRVYGF
jgi:hypothetical protein